MSLQRPADERYITLTITDEAVAIPSSLPYVKRLAEVPTSADLVTIRRITSAVKSGAGSGTFQSQGNYSGDSSKDYRVEIDTAGDIGGTATFKWGTVVGGVTTWRGTLIPIDAAEPFALELGVEVLPVAGAGTDFQVGDYWTFSAERWTEVTSVPIATKTYQVDYSKGDVTFFSGDAGLTVYASYEGRGSLIKAADLIQLIDQMAAGDVAMYEVDTSALAAAKAVSVDASGAFIYANASTLTKPAIGIVRVVGQTNGEIVTLGPCGGFVGLIKGKVYYLDAVDGGLTDSPPTTPGCLVQPVGVGLNGSTIFVRPSLGFQSVNQVVIGGCNTAACDVNRCVGLLEGTSTWQASGNQPVYSYPAIGFVKTKHATNGEVVIYGALDGFINLVPGKRYWVAEAAGFITDVEPTISGRRKQLVGFAISWTMMLVHVDPNWTIIREGMRWH